MADRLAVKGQQDRCHIVMNTDEEVRYWTRHLGVTREALQKAIEKVGNSAAAVRKELAASKSGKPSGDKAGAEKKNVAEVSLKSPPHP
jgi:hypothetical protein